MDVYVDGSGKTGKFAYVAEGLMGKKIKIFQKKGVTNNEAEYLAIIKALEEIKDKDICIHSDSQLVVNQLNNKFAIKEDRLRKLAEEVWKLAEGREVHYFWLPREKNKAGKVLG